MFVGCDLCVRHRENATRGQQRTGAQGVEEVAAAEHQLIHHMREHRLQHVRRPAGARQARHEVIMHACVAS